MDRKGTRKMKSFDDRVYRIVDVLRKYDCKLPFQCIIELSELLDKKEK